METLLMANAAAAVQVQQMNQHSPVEQLQQQQQIVSLSDMTDLTHDIQEDIVSIPKEVILISLVSQEQALYNPKHEHYRNTQRKDNKWLEISESVGWSESQCKSKWKAMRDQYCRELKRSKFNAKANVKWKYFKELDFLRPYALSRNYRPRNATTVNNINNHAATATLANNSFITNNNNNNNSSGASSNNNSITIDNNKFPNIKIEAGNFDPCEFTTTTSHIKNDTSRLIATTLTDEQLNNVIQQQQDGNWNYLTATTTTTAATRTNNHMPMDSSHLCQQQHQQQTSTADDVLYSAFVDCVTAAAAAGHMQQNQQQQPQLNHHQQQQQQQTEEEDDDPIHTFLNIESYFEKELIAMIQQEDILYNSFHANYRNIKLKLEVWDEIARKLKKTVKQCRLKWKALRDQYIREHKRLKNRENAETLPRWKHYDALNFLQKFIKHKSNDFDGKNIIQIPKTEMDTEIDDNIMNSSNSPLRSPMELQQQQQQHQQQIHTLPSLTGPHSHQQQQQLELAAQNNENICVASSVSAYDEMDIDNYIIGNASDDPHDDVVDDDVDEDDEDQEDRKSHQFPDYTNGSNDNNDTDEDEEFKEIKSTTQDSLQLPKQQTSQQQQQEQIIPLIISNGNTLTTDESLQHHNHNHHTDYNIDAPQTQTHPQTSSMLTVNGVVECVGGGGVVNSNNNNLSTDAINMVAAAITNGAGASAATTSLSSIAPPGLAGAIDDDEVGAFFKAVAMKIRSAKMSPVAFTDLQIDILRVINGTLRNH